MRTLHDLDCTGQTVEVHFAVGPPDLLGWSGPNRGRYGWSGGQGTNFFVDPDGTVGVMMTQVELGEQMWPIVEEFQALQQPSS